MTFVYKSETEYLDGWGICKRVSITHAAVRTPDQYPLEQHRELWELIASGNPVFPLLPEQLAVTSASAAARLAA